MIVLALLLAAVLLIAMFPIFFVAYELSREQSLRGCSGAEE